jgi:hypothetical protein
VAAVLTGTPVAISWGTSADPATQDVTIPSDATAVYFCWAYYDDGGGGDGLSTITLESVSPDQTSELANTTDTAGTGVAAWYNPTTGANQTFDVSWDAAPDEGPVCIVVFVKDGDTTGWRDVDTDQNSAAGGGDAVSVTLTTVSGDLVIKFDQRFATTVPSLSSGWTNGQTQANEAGESARLSYIEATTTTQVCDSEDENFSSIVAFSIPPGGPNITDVDTDEAWDDGDTGLVITGTGFVS